jgi:hypothetical protein
MVPIIDIDDKEDILDNVRNNLTADEILAWIPYEKDVYEDDEVCIDISNIESFRRIQQLILRAMVYSDSQRIDCPFCQHQLELIEDDNCNKHSRCKNKFRKFLL